MAPRTAPGSPSMTSRCDRGLLRGEQRILRIAASLGSDSPVVLGDEISGLDCDSLRLVLAAVAHASGQHEAGKTVELVDDKPRFVAIDPLYTWPAT